MNVAAPPPASAAQKGALLGGASTALPLLIRLVNGQTLSVSLPASSTVSDVMQLIHSRTGIPLEHQRLTHGGKQLQPPDRLCDVGVAAGSEIALMLSLRGGGARAMGTPLTPSPRTAESPRLNQTAPPKPSVAFPA